MVLLGPSGCGKTTLLRCLAGLERVDDGRVFIGDRDATDLPPRRRRIAMVFQSYAVFPHMKVYDNIAFGLRMQKEKKPVDRRARPLLRRAAPHRGAARPVLVPALGRTAAARCGRPGDGDESRRPADGRAALQPRRAAPPGDARRAEVAAAEPRGDDDLRHARPDRGALHGRPDRGDEQGSHRPARQPARGVRQPGRHVRRWLHRQSAHELPRGRSRRERRHLPSPSSAAGRSSCPARPLRWRATTSCSASGPRRSASRPPLPTGSCGRR